MAAGDQIGDAGAAALAEALKLAKKDRRHDGIARCE